jgi:hypothetical protein
MGLPRRPSVLRYAIADIDRAVPMILEELKIPVQIKLAALWASLMSCYIYGDYFGLYQPGALQKMIDGRMGPLGPTTQGVLLGTSIMMAIPSVMIFLSVALKPRLNRWLNIIFGAIYTAIMLMTMPGAWAFYIFLGVIEVALTSLVVWYAWKWPRREVPTP